MDKQPIAFMSYAHFDNENDNKFCTWFCKRLSNEVCAQTGEEFPIFQDQKDIKWGQNWKERIEGSIEGSTFFIPIITPTFFNSTACCRELEQFIQREKQLGRSDLILPVYYIECEQLKSASQHAGNNLAQIIAAHQYVDWRGLRHKSKTSREVKEKISDLARQIRDALERSQNTGSLDKTMSSLDSTTTPEAVDISTVFFYKRFCSAFPGVRGVEWFAGKDAIKRLSILLQEPLVFEIENGSRQPIWYWRNGEIPIDRFRVLDRSSVLISVYELKIKRMAAIRFNAYYQCFVYIEVEPMRPTGLYPSSQAEIEMIRKQYGYVSEEYGLYKGKYKVNRAQYDDNAAVIQGKICELGNEVELRIRYLTPFNIMIAAHGSPVNNRNFDPYFRELMNAILNDSSQFENLVEKLRQLPRGDEWEKVMNQRDH